MVMRLEAVPLTLELSKYSAYTWELLPPEIYSVSPGRTLVHAIEPMLVHALAQLVPFFDPPLTELSTYQLVALVEIATNKTVIARISDRRI